MKIILVLFFVFTACLLTAQAAPDTLWTKAISTSSSSEDVGFSIEQTPDGGFMIGAKGDFEYSGNIVLIKTNSQGDTLWSKQYNGIAHRYDAGDVKQTTDKGFIITGYSWFGYAVLYLAKTDSLGNIEWENSYSSLPYVYSTSVQQTNDDGYIVAGSTHFNDS